MDLVVQKYGGTSVGSIERIKNVATHIANTRKKGKQVIVVVSAMGQQTDDLHRMALELNPAPPQREIDMLLTVGERISMALLSIALHGMNIPSISLTGSQCGILTDENHGNARIQTILGDRIRQGLKKENVIIIAGFQGICPTSKEITTLGRGGSDLTAVALAHTLKASACELYKEVDGVFTADPRIVPSAKFIPKLSWNTLLELAWSGASIVHARAAHLVNKYSIPLEVRSSLNLQQNGTKIEGEIPVESIKIDSIAHKDNQTIITLKLPKEEQSLIGKGLRWLWKKGETPLVSNAKLAPDLQLTQVIASDLLEDYKKFLDSNLKSKKEKIEVISKEESVSAISIIGIGFWQHPETINRILSVCGDRVRFFESKNSAIVLCVEQQHFERTLKELHQAIFQN